MMADDEMAREMARLVHGDVQHIRKVQAMHSDVLAQHSQKLDEHGDKLDVLSADVSTLKGDVSTLKGDVSDLKDKMDRVLALLEQGQDR